jgi:PDZ domain-containing secreted protein
MKKVLYGILLLGLCIMAVTVFAENKTVTGTVEAIAEDGTSITVAGQKIATTQEMLDELYVEQGDAVTVTIEDAEGGPKLVDLEYNFDEMNGTEGVPAAVEEKPAVEAAPAAEPVAEAPAAEAAPAEAAPAAE